MNETTESPDTGEAEATTEAADATAPPEAFPPILTLEERVARLERMHVQFHGAMPDE